MKALTRFRRFLSIMLTLAIVFNSVDLSTINASATEVKEAEELQEDAGEMSDEDSTEEDENTGEESKAEADGEQSSQDADSSAADEAAADESADASHSSGEESETEEDGDAEAEEAAEADVLETESIDNLSVLYGSVTVSAELSGGIPEDVDLVVESADKTAILSAIDLEGAATTLYFAMSAHLEEDGAEYELQNGESVTLTLEGVEFDEDALGDMWFLHISDGEVVDDASFANAEYDSDFSYTDNGDGTYDVSFTTSSFSDFAIASQTYMLMTLEEEETSYEINLAEKLSGIEDVYSVNGNEIIIANDKLTIDIIYDGTAAYKKDNNYDGSYYLTVTGSENNITFKSFDADEDVALNGSSSAPGLKISGSKNTITLSSGTALTVQNANRTTTAAIDISGSENTIIVNGSLSVSTGTKTMFSISETASLNLTGEGKVSLDSYVLTNAGTLNIDGNVSVTFDCSVENSGTLNISDSSDVVFPNTVTIDSGAVLNLDGSATAEFTDGTFEGGGTLSLAGSSTMTGYAYFDDVETGFTIAYTGGTFFVQTSESYDNVIISSSNAGLLVGSMKTTNSKSIAFTFGSVSNDSYALPAHGETFAVFLAHTATDFAILGTPESSSQASYTGVLSTKTSETLSVFNVTNSAVTVYTNLSRVTEPSFSAAHYTKLLSGTDGYSVTLNTSVKLESDDSSELLSEVGFVLQYVYKIGDDDYTSSGGLDFSAEDDLSANGTISGLTALSDTEISSLGLSRGTYLSAMKAINAQESGDVTLEITGLAAGYIYVFAPYAVTTTYSARYYVANEEDTIGTLYSGTKQYKSLITDDSLTGTKNASIAVAIVNITWPDTIEMTYGDALGDIYAAAVQSDEESTALDENGYIGYTYTADEVEYELTTAVSILHDSSLAGTFSFDIYKDEACTQMANINSSGYYDVSGEYYVKMTFVPDTAARATETKTGIKLIINPMPVTVLSNGTALTANSEKSYLKVYDGSSTFTLNASDITLVGLRGNSTDGYTEDSDLTILANKEKTNDNVTVSATAKSGSTSVYDANTLYNKSGTIEDKTAYTLSLTGSSTGMSSMIDPDNYTFVSAGTSYADASDNPVESTLYGWIAQRQVSASIVVNKMTAVDAYDSSTMSVITGQYFYITVDATTVDDVDESGLVSNDSADDVFGSLTFDISGSSNTTQSAVKYGTTGQTRLTEAETVTIATASGTNFSEVFTGNYYPVTAKDAGATSISGSLDVTAVVPAVNTNYEISGEPGSNNVYISEVTISAKTDGGYDMIALTTSRITDIDEFSEVTSVTVSTTGTHSIQLYNSVTGAFTTVGSTAELTIDIGAPTITKVELVGKNEAGTFGATVNKLTFGFFFKEAIQVTITAQGGDSGFSTLHYWVNGTENTYTFKDTDVTTGGDGTMTATCSFTIPLDEITSSAGGVYFYVVNGAGVSSSYYTVSTKEESGVSELKYESSEWQIGDATIIVAESTAPTAGISVSGTPGNTAKENDDSVVGWLITDGSLTINVNDPEGTDSKAASGIASYTVTWTAYNSSGGEVAGSSGSEKVTTSKTTQEAFDSVQQYTDEWTGTVKETDGVYYYKYTVSVTDNAGTTTEASKYIYVDTTAPTLTGSVTANTTGATNETSAVSTVDLSGVSAGASVTLDAYTMNDISVSLTVADATSGVANATCTYDTDTLSLSDAGNGTWTGTITQNGTYVFTVTDAAGNSTTKTVEVTGMDQTNPSATLSYTDADGTAYTPGSTNWSSAAVTVTATVTDEAAANETASGFAYLTYSYILNGATNAMTGQTEIGTYSFTLSESGTYTDLTVTAYDKAGNSYPVSVSESINIDTNNPNLSVAATLDAVGGTDYDGSWAKSGQSIVLALSNTNTSSTSDITYYITTSDPTSALASGSNMADLFTTTAADWAASVSAAEWNDTTNTLTFGSSYEGTLYIAAKSASGLWSEVASKSIKISTESLSQATVKYNTDITPSSNWYDSTELVMTVNGVTATNAEATATPSNTITTSYKLYYATEQDGDYEAVSGASGSLVYNHGDKGFTDGNSSATIADSYTTTSGYYKLVVTVVDAAGNEAAEYTQIFKRDATAPVPGNVTYTVNEQTGLIATVLNKLSFGIFGKSTVKVSIAVSDEDYGSGAATLYYQIGDGEAKSVNVSNGAASFDLEIGTSGYIKYWAKDTAGNTSSQYNLGYDSSDTDDAQIVWLLENDVPTITDRKATGKAADDTTVVTITPADADAQTDNVANSSADVTSWIAAEAGATVSATITDTDSGSGLSSVSASYVRVDSFSDILNLSGTATATELSGTCYASADDKTVVKLGSDTSATEKVTSVYWESAALTESGIYKVTISAEDNATNESGEYILYVYVDSTNPTIGTASYNTGWRVSDDLPLVVPFTASDANSGVKSVTVSVDSGDTNDYLSTNYGTATYTDGVWTQTLTESGGNYSFGAKLNGTYTITVTDYAGNVTTQDVVIGNIDTEAPTADGSNAILEVTAADTLNNQTYNPTGGVYYTSDSITVTLKAADAISGIKSYTLYYKGESDAQAEVWASGTYETAQNLISVDISVTKTGRYKMWVVITDDAGNTYTMAEADYLDIYLVNSNPSADIARTVYYTETSSETYTSGDWVSAEKVVLTVKSGLTTGNADYYVAIDPDGVTAGKDVQGGDWIALTDQNIAAYSTYGTIGDASNATDGDILTFTITNEGSHTYYFKVVNNQDNTGKYIGYSAVSVVNIDNTTPSAASYSISNNANGGNTTNGASDLWYNTTLPTVTLTDVADSVSKSTLASSAVDSASAPHTMYYLLSTTSYDESTDADTIKGSSDVQSTAVTSSGVTTQTTTMASDGVRYLYYWTVDDAGNSSTIVKETIKADTTSPTIQSISVVDYNDTSLAAALSFGVFSKTGYTVTVNIEDPLGSNGLENGISGVSSLTWVLKDSDGNTVKTDTIESSALTYTGSDYTAAATDGSKRYATASFSIYAESDVFSDCIIEVYATDVAGNVGTRATATNANGTDVWTYSVTAPTIELSASPTANVLGWISTADTNDVVVTANVTEETAGLNKVTYEITGKNTGSGTLYENPTEKVTKLAETTNSTITISGAEDGTTETTVSATTNAGNSADKTLTLQIDGSAPKFEQTYAQLATSGWHNEKQDVTFTLSDSVSGIWKESIIVYSGGSAVEANKLTLNADYTITTDSQESTTNYTDGTASTATSCASYTVTLTNVSANGTYYVVATDLAGNQVTGTVVVDNIDLTIPGTVSITPSGTEEGTGSGWYSGSDTKVTIKTELPETVVSNITLYYTVTRDDGSSYYASGSVTYNATTNEVTGSTTDITGTVSSEGGKSYLTTEVSLPNDGQYVVLAGAMTAAGICDSGTTSITTSSGIAVTVSNETTNKATVKVDQTAAEVDYTKITVTDKANGLLANIANFLSPGNFFSSGDGITITLSGTDKVSSGNNATSNYSNIAKAYYQLNGTDSNWTEVSATSISTDGDNFTFSFDLTKDQLSNGATIYVKTVDTAGNESDATMLVATNSATVTDGNATSSTADATSSKWLIDTTVPTIGNESYTDGSSVEITETNGYYNSSSVIISVGVSDSGNSGLNKDVWEVAYTAVGASEATTSTETVTVGTSAKSWDSEIVKSDTLMQTFTDDGTYVVKLTVTDNATNVSTTEIYSFKIDSTEAELGSIDEISAGWQTEAQTLNFTIVDAFSGFTASTVNDGSGVTLTQTYGTTTLTSASLSNINVSNDGKTLTGSVTITENGIYTLTWTDVAGNKDSKTITVDNVDTTPVSAPTVTFALADGTGSTISSSIDATHTNWYVAKDTTLEIKITPNLTTSAANGSDETTYYLLWNASAGGTQSDTSAISYATSTGGELYVTSANAIDASKLEDGVWHLIVWNEDVAHTDDVYANYYADTTQKTGVTEYIFCIDRTDPTVSKYEDTQPESGSTTGSDVTLTFALTDGTGSGIDTTGTDTKPYLSWKALSSSDNDPDTETFAATDVTTNSDGTVTVTYEIGSKDDQTNGIWTLYFQDYAGNTNSYSKTVNTMDATALEDASVYYAVSDTAGESDRTKLSTSSTKYLNLATVYLYVSGDPATTATWTYTGTLTAPDSNTETYTNDGNQSTGLAAWLKTNLGSQEGKWTLETKTTTNQNLAPNYQTKTYTIVIDQTAPLIQNAVGNTLTTDVETYTVDGNLTEWTKDDVMLSFKVSDPTTKATDVSGIDTVKVTMAGASGEISCTVQDGTYSFTAAQNGTYTITVTDKAGNETTYVFDVTNIDKTVPDTLVDTAITVTGTTGTSGVSSTSGSWYKRESTNNAGTTTVTITLPTNGTGTGTAATAPYTTYYMYWAVDVDAPTQYLHATSGDYTVGSFKSASSTTGSFNLPDGEWNLVFWVEDEAGNTTDSAYYTKISKDTESLLMVYTDLTLPETDYTKITIAETGTTALAQIANFLTFGNFFNEGFKITLSGITDETSGVASVWYATNNDADNAPTDGYTEATYNNISGSYEITFTDAAQLGGYIWVYVKDGAGNTTAPYALKAYEQGSAQDGTSKWVIDTVNPTVSIEETTDPADTGWYNSDSDYPSVTATAKDGVDDQGNTVIASGIGQLLQTIFTKATEAASYPETGADTTVFPTAADPLNSIVTTKTGTYTFSGNDGDGVFKIVYEVTDNVYKTASDYAEVKIDKTAPSLTASVETDYTSAGPTDTFKTYFTTTTWTNKEQLVTLTASDVTSGIRKIVVETEKGSLKTQSDEYVSEITFNVADDDVLKSNNAYFYICANGDYKVTATDVAGNTTTYTFTVSNVDTTDPDGPEVKITEQTGTEYNDTDDWYYGTAYPTIDITPGEETDNLAAGVTTCYMLWNTSAGESQPTDGTEYKASVDGYYPVFTKDGIYKLIVWTEDAAGNKTYATNASASSPMTINVDIDNSATLTGSSDEPTTEGEYTTGPVTVTFTFNDQTGSGIDWSTLKLTWAEDASSATTDFTDNKISSYTTNTAGNASGEIKFTVSSTDTSMHGNGVWTLTYQDVAGNTQTATCTITRIDPTTSEGVPLPTMTLYTGDVVAASETKTVGEETQYWYDDETLTLKFTRSDDYTEISPIETVVTVTAPDGTVTTYTVTDDYGTPVGNTELYTSGISFVSEGKWTVSVTATSGNGAQNTTTQTWYVDRTEPEASDISKPDSWTNQSADITFKVTDSAGSTTGSLASGVESVTVTAGQDGASLNEGVYELTAVDGVYTFTANSNGTYTVTMTDYAGNVKTVDIVVTYIDKTAPQNAGVSISGTKGQTTNVGNEEYGWYIIETQEGGKNQITITANEQAENYTVANGTGTYDSTKLSVYDEAGISTYVKLYKKGGTGAETGTVTTDGEVTSAADGGYWIVTLAEDGTPFTVNLAEGIWTLEVWTRDAATNMSATKTATIYVDKTKPVVENSTITVTNTSTFAKIGNFLTFGNFFNEAIRITVDVTDETSGLYELKYQVGDSATVEPTGDYLSATVNTESSSAYFEFDTSQAQALLDGYIWVYAVDAAGNESEPFALKAYTGGVEGSDYWMIDTVQPTISLTLTDSNEASRAGTWFTAVDETAGTYPVVWANIREGFAEDANVSGLNLVTRTVLIYNGTDYEESIAAVTLYQATNTQEYTGEDEYVSDHYSMTDLTDGDHDGMYKVIYYVVDNAGNDYTKEIEVNVDTTAANASVDTTCEWYTNQYVDSIIVKDPQKVVLSTDDDETNNPGASGVDYVLVTAKTGSVGEAKDGSDATTEITLYPDDDGNVSFYVCENGEYEYVVYDKAGNASVPETISVTNMDTTAPEITETSPADGKTDVDYKDPVITVTVLDDSKGTITYDAENPITIEVNGVTYTIDPEDYPDAITINSSGTQAKDENGNELYLTDDQGEPILDASGEKIPLYDTTITIDLSKIDGLTYEQEVEVPVYDPVTGDPVYEKDEYGNPIRATDESGNLLYDDEDNPIYVQETETQTLNCLDADTVYTVTIPEGAFTDEAGNPTAAETITFTTAEASEDDPWLEAKTLEDVEIAGIIVDEEDGSTSYDTTNITTSPEFDADTGSYTLFVAPGALDPTLTELAEDLAVIISYDEFVGSEVTVSIKDANMTVIASVDYATVTANESAYVQEIPKTDEDGNPVYKTDVNGDPIQATDGEGKLLYEDEEETIPIYEQETEKVVVVTFTADQVNEATANGFGILEVVTNNHGSKSTYTYVVSVNGISENLTNQASTTGDHGNVEITVPSGAIVSALNNRISELIGTAQTGFTKLAVQMITTVPRESAITEAVGRIESVWSSSKWNKRQLYYFDFTLNIISNGVVEEVSETDELEDADPNAFIANQYKTIPITITLPSELKGYSEYAVFYDHEGVADYFGATDDSENGIVVLSADGTQLTIYASQFSIYAVTGKTITSSSDTSGSSGSGSGSSTETVYVTNTVTQTSVTYVPVRSVKGSSGSGGTVETTSQTENTGTAAKDEEEAGDEDIGGEETEEAAAATVCPGIKDGLALINLLMAVFSLMTAEYSTLKQKKKKKIPNDILCIASLLLFFITQPLEGLITRVDEWTPWFVVIFAVQLVITVLKFKSDEEEPEAETAGAEKN